MLGPAQGDWTGKQAPSFLDKAGQKIPADVAILRYLEGYPWIAIRPTPSGPWWHCLLCGKDADTPHLLSDTHTKKAADPAWYYDTPWMSSFAAPSAITLSIDWNTKCPGPPGSQETKGEGGRSTGQEASTGSGGWRGSKRIEQGNNRPERMLLEAPYLEGEPQLRDTCRTEMERYSSTQCSLFDRNHY